MVPNTETVTLYCLPRFAECAHVHRWLDSEGFDVGVIDASSDDTAQAFLAERGFRGLPVVRTTDGAAAWGVEPERLTAELPMLARTSANTQQGAPR